MSELWQRVLTDPLIPIVVFFVLALNLSTWLGEWSRKRTDG